MPIAKDPHNIHCIPSLPVYLRGKVFFAFALEIFDDMEDS